MSQITVKYRASFRTARRPSRNGDAAVHRPEGKSTEDKPSGPSRAARLLSLAHHVERQIDAGELIGYAEAARILGLTRARLTQVMNLLLLAPETQERVLVGEFQVTERGLRCVVAKPDWSEQFAICEWTNEDAKPTRRKRAQSPA